REQPMTSHQQMWTEIVRYVLIFSGSCILGAVVLAIVGALKAPHVTAEVLQGLIRARTLVRIATILSIIGCVFVLALTKKITGEAAIATLSGIAGYVLGREQQLREGPATPTEGGEPRSS